MRTLESEKRERRAAVSDQGVKMYERSTTARNILYRSRQESIAQCQSVQTVGRLGASRVAPIVNGDCD